MATKINDKGPFFTTFRRRVRRKVWPCSPELPIDIIKGVIRAHLNEAKHTVDESSWRDDENWEYFARAPIRMVSVRYVTGGMRHGLGESIELQPRVSIVEFVRAHRLPRPPRTEDSE